MNFKDLVNSEEWKELKDIFEKEIIDNAKTQNIKETLSAEHIKLEVMSRNKACKIMRRALRHIEKMSFDNTKNKIIYE